MGPKDDNVCIHLYRSKIWGILSLVSSKYREVQEMQIVIPEDQSKDAWKQEWEASGLTRLHRHVSDPGEGVKGEDLSRKHWTTLDRLRTGFGHCRSSMKKWGLAVSAACEWRRSGGWRSVQHVSVASHNRRLITSSTCKLQD